MRIKALALASVFAFVASPVLAQVIIGGGGSGGGGGAGNVVGPASSTDGGISLFDGTTGQLLKDGGTLSSLLDGVGSTRGSVLYRGASGWTVLTPGTSGFFLKSNGAGADPSYASAAGSGTVTSVACGNGLSCSTAPITTTGTISTSVTQNAQTGTTYTTLSTDAGKVVTLSNASAIAVSLVQANTANFTSGFGTTYANLGAGLVTVTAATSTFGNGLTTLALAKGQVADIASDSTNYPFTAVSLPVMAADTVLGNFSGTANYPIASAALSSCSAASSALTYNTSTHAFGCNTISGGGSPGGSTTQLQVNNASSFGGISTLTVDLTNGYLTNSAASAASAPAFLVSGTPFSGGTGTTTFPHVYIATTGATAPTTFSTSGTLLGGNAASGIGRLIDFRVNGSSTAVFQVDSSTNLTVGASVTIGATSLFSIAGKSRIASSTSGEINFKNASNVLFFEVSDTAGMSFVGTAPTPTGTGTPTIATGSTDTAGEVTAGASATSVVITFAASKTNAPFCVVTSQTQLAAFAYTISTSAITITQTATSGNKIDYHCIQH